MPCRINMQEQWTLRLIHESKLHTDSCFTTLTFDEQHYTGTVSKYDAQCFLKRLRKFIYPKKIRYFMVGEYGETYGRAHYHIIIFGMPPGDSTRAIIQACWRNGNVDKVSSFEDYRARYCAKYVCKKLTGKMAEEYYTRENKEPEFLLMSRRPGIGMLFAMKYLDNWVKNGFITIEGHKKSIPKYYLTKMSSDMTEELRYKKYHSERSEDTLKLTGNYKVDSEMIDARNEQTLKNIKSKQNLKRSANL